MELNWLQSILLGLISGITDILPVSAQAHRLVILKLFGQSSEPVLLRLTIHIGTLAALYYGCRGQILRLTRAQKQAKIPKRRRKRPLDTRSLTDFSLLKTSLIPIILAFFFYRKTSTLNSNLILVALFLFLNGIMMYIPQYLPSANKDSGNVSRLEGLLLGLGGAASTVPGISCIGAASSIGSICGMEQSYTLNIALLMNIPVMILLSVFDVLAVVEVGIAGVSFSAFFGFLLAGAAAFIGTLVGLNLLRRIVSSIGYPVFAFYCWGGALFAFILSLTI